MKTSNPAFQKSWQSCPRYGANLCGSSIKSVLMKLLEPGDQHKVDTPVLDLDISLETRLESRKFQRTFKFAVAL